MKDVKIRINGMDDYWALMLAAATPFTAQDIASKCDAGAAVISDFCRRMVKGGFAEVTFRKGRIVRYKLLKRPLIKPRLNTDGSEFSETKQETIWRSMRMAKTFTLASLMEFASTSGAPMPNSTVRIYMKSLQEVGIIKRVSPRSNSYLLARNLGARAPRVLKTRIVFDPNAQAVVGVPVAHEVQS